MKDWTEEEVELFQNALLEAHYAMEKGLIEQYVAAGDIEITDDWVYRDLPWTIESVWYDVLNNIGPANYRMIASSRRTDPDGVEVYCGQFLIAPEGIENLKNEAARRDAE